MTLYSTGCPNCKVLKMQLDRLGIEYDTNDNTQEMIEKGFSTVPILEIDGEYLNFTQALNYIKGMKG